MTCSIHPRYKHEVAYRLALGARAVAYGEQNVVFQGPFPTRTTLHSMSKELTIEFDANINVKNNTGFDVRTLLLRLTYVMGLLRHMHAL